MGNEVSGSSSAWRQPAIEDVQKYAAKADPKFHNCPQKTEISRLQSKLSKNAMAKLQKKILAEYPYLSNIKESMVVGDNRLPDCPIVFVNDEFEKLTLYPREEIIGRNCRFLQGRYTNKETVRKIRHAVDNGLPLDVEIFNYRKDGTGFFNNFLLLPVHKHKDSSQVTHFVAIQKDITLIRPDKNALLWTPPECAMWFEYLKMGHLADLLVENGVEGKTLVTLNEEDLLDLGVQSPTDRKTLLPYIAKLHRRPEAAYRVLTESDGAAITFNGVAQEVCLANPKNQEIWRQEGGNDLTDKMEAIKCFFRDDIVIFRGHSISWSQINKMVESNWHMPMKFRCLNTGQKIKNSSEWEKVLQAGHVLLRLNKKEREIPEAVRNAYDLLTFLVVLVDSEGIILFVNQAASYLLDRNRDDLTFLPYDQMNGG